LTPIFYNSYASWPVKALINRGFPYFKSLTALFFGVLGAKKLYSNVKQSELNRSITPIAQSQPLLFFGVGTCDALVALQAFSILKIHNYLKPISFVGNVLFLILNILNFCENASSWLSHSNGHPTSWANIGSGLISNLNYIAATAFVLFGFQTAWILLLYAIGAAFGGIRLFLDVFSSEIFIKHLP
jgi:hypothetical protein